MTIRQRLLRVEDDFLSAVSDGSVESFDEQWTVLLQDIESAIQLSSLDEETISLAHIISSRISILADTFQELHAVSDTLTANLMSDLDAMASQLTLGSQSHIFSSPAQSSKDRIVSAGRESTVESFDFTSNPQISPTPSLVSLSTADDSDEDAIPLSVIGCKRSADSLDESDIGSSRADRFVKRPRASYIHSNEAKDIEIQSVVFSDGTLHPPSPPSLLSIQDSQITGSSQMGGSQRPDPPSRKRRLSESDTDAPPKRPRGLSVRPRLQAVSDPFPDSTSFGGTETLNDWFKFDFRMPDEPLLSWQKFEPFDPVRFDLWAAVDMKSSDLTHPIIDDLQSVTFSSLESTSPPVYQCDTLSEEATKKIRAGTAVVSSPLSDLFGLPVGLQERSISVQSSFPTPSSDGVIFAPSIDLIPTTIAELSPSLHQKNLPDITAATSTEPDVISMYTTLHDPTCSDASQHVLDFSVVCPPTFLESLDNEGDWAHFLGTLDQPPEVVLPSLPPPNDPSTEVARLLECLLQAVEGSEALSPDCTQVLSDKQSKLKELEAAKEAVRRLEAEVGHTVSS